MTKGDGVLSGRGRPRRARGVEAYERAEEEARVGDHAITPELVRGAKVSKAVKIEPDAPVAHRVLEDLITLQWSEIRGLVEKRANGKLDEADREYLVKLTDATTKALREERQQADREDWSRLTEDEIIDMLPEEEAAALRASRRRAPQTLPASSGEE